MSHFWTFVITCNVLYRLPSFIDSPSVPVLLCWNCHQRNNTNGAVSIAFLDRERIRSTGRFCGLLNIRAYVILFYQCFEFSFYPCRYFVRGNQLSLEWLQSRKTVKQILDYMCIHVSTVHPVGRWMHYVFDLSNHLCVNVCLPARIPSGDISRSACRRLLVGK